MTVNVRVFLVLLYFEFIVEHTSLHFVRCRCCFGCCCCYCCCLDCPLHRHRRHQFHLSPSSCIVLKCDTLLVIECPSLFRAVIHEWCLCVTVYGTSLKYGVSLSPFRCLTRTQSPTLIPLSFTFRLLSAYRLWYSFFVASFCRASRCRFTRFRLCNIGSFPLTVLLNNSSAGGKPVVECGVVRYCNRNLLSSCCHGRFSTFAVRNVLPSGCMNLSASAFPWGPRVVENFDSIPNAVKYREYSSSLKGGRCRS